MEDSAGNADALAALQERLLEMEAELARLREKNLHDNVPDISEDVQTGAPRAQTPDELPEDQQDPDQPVDEAVTQSGIVSGSSSTSWPWATPLNNTDAIPEVRHCNLTEFKNRFSSKEGRYAVDVLVSGELLDDEIEGEARLRKGLTEAGRIPSRKARGKAVALAIAQNANFNQALRRTQQARGQNWIQRVRIQSLALLKILQKVQGETWTPRPRTYFRPFPSLVYFHKKVKRVLADLEARYGGGSGQHPHSQHFASTPATTEGPTPGPSSGAMGDGGADDLEDQIDDCPAALDILRAYVQFFDSEIMPESQQYKLLNCGSNARVRFSDLWFLFRAGELVYRSVGGSDLSVAGQATHSSGGEESKVLETAWKGKEVWRVYGVDPGEVQHRAAPTDHRKYDADEEQGGDGDDSGPRGSLELRAYHLDHTGDEFAVVSKRFTIPPFKGSRPVNSLPIYPLRFAPDQDKPSYVRTFNDAVEAVKDKTISLLEGGQQRHGSYNAWTVTRTPSGGPVTDPKGNVLRHPEHINSEVMVDFSEAFQICPSWRPPRVVLRSRALIPQSIESDEFPILWWSGRDRSRVLGEASELVPVRTGVGMWLQNAYICERDPLLAAVAANDAHGRPTTGDYIRPEDKILVTDRVFAYVFQERKFAQLDAQFLFPADESGSTEALNALRIPEHTKQMIQRSVRGHFLQKERIEGLQRGPGAGAGVFGHHYQQLMSAASALQPSSSSYSLDPIRGKGSGLFILLHGVPGVGKTATAEAVAQASGKPLFKISCGDLGLSPDQVESSLRGIFRLASLWDCILLMDEVDTFFSQRSKADGAMTKNALVSVFLRVLDYYTGILFLTTNRAGALDEAFKSRIHCKIYYPALTREQTLEIWELNIRRLRMIEKEQQMHWQRQQEQLVKQSAIGANADENQDSTGRVVIDLEEEDHSDGRIVAVSAARRRQQQQLQQQQQWPQRLQQQRPMAIPANQIMEHAKDQFDSNQKLGLPPWSGRQIRNAFQVARSLAYADFAAFNMGQQQESASQQPPLAPRLDVKYFELLRHLTESFDKYRRNVYAGMNDDELAAEREERPKNAPADAPPQIQLGMDEGYDDDGAPTDDDYIEVPNESAYRVYDRPSQTRGPHPRGPQAFNSSQAPPDVPEQRLTEDTVGRWSQGVHHRGGERLSPRSVLARGTGGGVLSSPFAESRPSGATFARKEGPPGWAQARAGTEVGPATPHLRLSPVYPAPQQHPHRMSGGGGQAPSAATIGYASRLSPYPRSSGGAAEEYYTTHEDSSIVHDGRHYSDDGARLLPGNMSAGGVPRAYPPPSSRSRSPRFVSPWPGASNAEGGGEGASSRLDGDSDSLQWAPTAGTKRKRAAVHVREEEAGGEVYVDYVGEHGKRARLTGVVESSSSRLHPSPESKRSGYFSEAR